MWVETPCGPRAFVCAQKRTQKSFASPQYHNLAGFPRIVPFLPNGSLCGQFRKKNGAELKKSWRPRELFKNVGIKKNRIPTNLVVVRKIKIVQTELMKVKDTRIKVTNETLASMKVIKFYAWENSFNDKIDNIREEELELLRQYGFSNIFYFFSSLVSLSLSLLCSFFFLWGSVRWGLGFKKIFCVLSFAYKWFIWVWV